MDEYDERIWRINKALKRFNNRLNSCIHNLSIIFEGRKSMSGGRFNYVDETLMSEMFGYLDEDDTIPNVMEDREISELTYDLLKLIHEYDWYACCDTGKEDYLKAKKAFKKKWFGTNRGLRIKRIVDEAVEHTREELYETFDVKKE